MEFWVSSWVFEQWLYPPFLAVFAVIYCLGHLAVFRHWKPKKRLDAASCLISLSHGTPAVLLALAAIRSQTVRGFAAPNTRLQDHVLDYSIAYFTMDLLHYLLFIPGDYLFIAHHLATLFVFVTCRYVVYHGAYALLVLLALAEVTSLCQNIWTLAEIRRDELPVAARVYRLLSPPFYILYSGVRGILGPLFFFKMSAFYLTRQALDVIPWWVRISWIIVVGAAIAVSNLWIWNLWKELFREQKQKVVKKET